MQRSSSCRQVRTPGQAGELFVRIDTLEAVDRAALAVYCTAYARWVQAERAIAGMAKRDMLTGGLMIKTSNGNAIQNPLVGTANTTASDMVRYAAEFGVTPSARVDETEAAGHVRFHTLILLLCTVPGIGTLAAVTILAEIGTDMSRFPTSGHLPAWAGMCPGQNESAGKRKSSRLRKGALGRKPYSSNAHGRPAARKTATTGAVQPLTGQTWSTESHLRC